MKKKTININIETLDNWWKMITYISSTLSFWKVDDKWPISLCKNSLDELSDLIYTTIHQDESQSEHSKST